MKVNLNEAEVKQALTQFIKTNFLNYEDFDIEVLNFSDDCGESLGLDVKATIGVSKQVVEKARPPCAPSPAPNAIASAVF